MSALNVVGENASAGARAYNSVNGGWPETIPAMTFNQAKAFVRKAWKQELPSHRFCWSFKVTSGRRYSWPRRKFYLVNVGNGWKELVHDVSHKLHHCKCPQERPHADTHRAMERRLTLIVLENGFLDGKFMGRQPKAKPELLPAVARGVAVHAKLSAIDAKLARWNTKAKRAATAIKKLQKQRKYYARKPEAAL